MARRCVILCLLIHCLPLYPLLMKQAEAKETDHFTQGILDKDLWYNVDGIPDVDLEGLVANLSAKMSWFKYIGNVTLECAESARRQETLMLAIEELHDCLHVAYQRCASQFARQGDACSSTLVSEEPCGILRLGYSDHTAYDNNVECSWHLLVPEGFHLNLTFDQFYLEYSGDDCTYDYVQVFDGVSHSGRDYGRRCGRLAAFSLYAEGRQMLVNARTDLTVTKYGFRAVFQVMDPGYGRNNQPLARLHGNFGQINLTSAWWTVYERIVRPYYYYMWHVITDVSTVVTLQVRFKPDIGAIFTVYDGTSMNNAILGRLEYKPMMDDTIKQSTTTAYVNSTTDSSTNRYEDIFNTKSQYTDVAYSTDVTEVDARESDITDNAEAGELEWMDWQLEGSSSHQILLVLQRPTLEDNTDLSAVYRGKPKPELQEIHNHQCLGDSMLEVKNGESDILIGLRRDSSLVDGEPVQCMWSITAPEDMFVQLHVTSLIFNSPTTPGCDDEGLLLVDGATLTPLQPRYGPFCFHHPKGLFTNYAHGGVNNITSSSRHFLVMYYSYVNYKSSPWQRGTFMAKLRATQCKGYFQPCRLEPDIEDTYYRVTANVTDTRLELEFSCNKDKCCIVQQLPIYRSPDRPFCFLWIKAEGDTVLATSEFNVNMAVPNKVDTEIGSGCEQQAMIERRKPGGSKYRCLGTQVFMSYHSNTTWSQGAYSARIEPAKCGYYRPDLHSLNEFYPPCVRIESPIGFEYEKKFEVDFMDPWSSDNRYYTYFIDFNMPKCRKYKKCVNITVELVGDNEGDVWTNLEMLPWRWSTWGRSSQNAFWRQKMKVSTYPNNNEMLTECLNITRECELLIQFYNSSIPEAIERNAHHQCDSHFVLVGVSCYRWIFPGNMTVATGVGSQLNTGMSNMEAHEKCEALGKSINKRVHLVDVDSSKESLDIKNHVFLKDYRRVLSRLPGVKVIHITVNDKKQARKYVSSREQQILHHEWHIPRLIPTMPDLLTYTSTSNSSQTHIMQPVRDDSIRQALAHLQPWNDPLYRCTALLIIGHTLPYGWVKVPCGRRINGAVALCETDPLKLYNKYDMSIARTHVQETPVGHQLQMHTLECPASMSYMNGVCYSIFSPIIAQAAKNNAASVVPFYSPQARCPEEFRKGPDGTKLISAVREAIIGEDEVEDISILLNAWRFTEIEQGIRVNNTELYNVSNRSFWKYCWTLEPHPDVDTLGKHTFTLKKSEGCQMNDTAKSFMCEAEPVPVKDACKPHVQFPCTDGTCITMQSMCDGQADCLDASDELLCGDVCEPNEPTLGEKINCYIDCHHDNCTCSPKYYQCDIGGCISLSKHCDNSSDCPDNSDELTCNYIQCIGKDMQCKSNQQCVPFASVCDGLKDCEDGTDEENCTSGRQCWPGHKDFKMCADGETCLHVSYHDDIILDCPGGGNMTLDELKYVDSTNSLSTDQHGVVSMKRLERVECRKKTTSCEKFLTKCYDRMQHACVLDHHPVTETLSPCRMGQHLQHCQHFQCPSMYKCPESYCIPIKRVCDGVNDCRGGEDEQQCDRYHCPGLFQCKDSTRCIRQHQVCDGTIDCPVHRDDETLCEKPAIYCPSSKCQCVGRTVNCDSLGISNLQDIDMPHTASRSLIYRNNLLNAVPSSLKNYKLVVHLDFSNNEIITVGAGALNSMYSLKHLNLENNKLESISHAFLGNLHNLKVLSLQGNRLSHVVEGAFKDLRSLPTLDLSNQYIRLLEKGIFVGMKALRMLNLSSNSIRKIDNGIFSTYTGGKGQSYLHNLQWLSLQNNPIAHTEPEAFKVKQCYPEPDEFSTCSDLISNNVLRVMVWTLGITGFIGNSFILYRRLRHERETAPSMLLLHMTLANIFVSLNLLTVASADRYTRGSYIAKSEEWMSHSICKFVGFLHMLGVELSIFLTSVMAADRKRALNEASMYRGLSVRTTRLFIIMGWVIFVIVSALPIMELPVFGKAGFVRNGVCMLFGLMEGQRQPAWPYFSTIFIVFNSMCLIYMLTAITDAYSGAKDAANKEKLPVILVEVEDKEMELTFRDNERVIFRRLAPVMLCCFILWTSLTVINALSLYGMQHDRFTSALVSLVLVPLYSVLTPFLYTLSGTPYRPKVDTLLLNWQMDPEDETLDDLDAEGTTPSEFSHAPTTTDGGRDLATIPSMVSSTVVTGSSSASSEISFTNKSKVSTDPGNERV